MSTIDVLVDNNLHVDANVLGHDLVEEILDLLTIPNEEKVDQKHRNTFGWEKLPDDFLLADLDGDTLVMPRGFALSFKQLLREHRHRVHWIDERCWEYAARPFEMSEGFEPRRHQPEAIRKICRFKQGIYVAPTGSGKTVSIIASCARLRPARSIIIVNRIDLVNQWAKEFLRWTTLKPHQIGKIGEGEWTEGIVTIATTQSIWSAIDELIEADWFDQWSFAWLDECHHVTADTLNEIMNRFTSRVRGGTSATPAKTGDFRLATVTLGDIFHEDDYDVLKEDGVLLEPTVEIVATDFDMLFWGDHRVDEDEFCEIPDCPRNGTRHGHRNNYGKVKAALVRDNVRNHLIASKVEEHLGRVQLIVSNETTHLNEIRDVLGSSLYGIPQDQIYMLTGKQRKKGEREEIIAQLVAAGEGILLSTVAGEGLDVPIIDVVHMPFPTKNPDTTRQIVGRAMRTATGKTSCLILDYADKNMSVFRSQLSSRVQKCYVKMGFQVTGHHKARQPQRRRGRGLGRML